jgi:hypothetical protein
MSMRLKLFALGLGALILMTNQAYAEPAAPAAPTPTLQPVSTEPVPVAPPKADPSPEKVVKVCHYEDVSGSMIPKKVCRSG